MALPNNLGDRPCYCALDIAAAIQTNLPAFRAALSQYADLLENPDCEPDLDDPRPPTYSDLAFLLGEIDYAVSRCHYRYTIE